MIKSLDGWDIAAHVRFVRQVHKGTIVVVEGEKDDRVLSRFVDGAKCTVEISFGKANAIAALDLLEDEGFPGVVAVVDADFDRIHNNQHALSGLILTDGHDIDVVILKSPALRTFLREYADGAKLRALGEDWQSKVYDLVLSGAAPIAYCRAISSAETLMLDFKDLSFDFINAATLDCDLEKLLNEIYASSPVARCTKDELRTKFDTEKAKNHNLFQLVNGHDAASVLGVALREILSNKPRHHTWGSMVESSLRLAFDFAAFKTTKIFDDLRKWEVANPPYTVLTIA